MKHLAKTGLVFALFGSAAFAQPMTSTVPPGKLLLPGGPHSPQRLKGECKEDRHHYCPNAVPGHGAVIGCLYDHRAKLSTKCREAMAPGFAAWEVHINDEFYAKAQAEFGSQSKKQSSPPRPANGSPPQPK